LCVLLSPLLNPPLSHAPPPPSACTHTDTNTQTLCHLILHPWKERAVWLLPGWKREKKGGTTAASTTSSFAPLQFRARFLLLSLLFSPASDLITGTHALFPPPPLSSHAYRGTVIHIRQRSRPVGTCSHLLQQIFCSRPYHQNASAIQSLHTHTLARWALSFVVFRFCYCPAAKKGSLILS
jgi:hypothetical protein